MIMYDTHMHTEYSTDSETHIRAQIRKAEQLGLQGICVTDHMDYEFPPELWEHPMEGLPFTFDMDDYYEHLQREKENAKISVLCGIECGLQTDRTVIEKNSMLVKNKDWDYIIGSIHLVHKSDPYYASFWEGKEPQECVKEYFNCMLENLQQFSSFDALGHLDYIVRYAPSSFHYEPTRYMELIDAVLQLLIRKDIALEINTSGWKTENRCQNPHLAILERYISLGGELITIGSDAHTPEYIAYRFDDLSELIKKAGLRQYCVYKKRKPVFFDL